MDLAMFSPRKLHQLDQFSPKISARKRSLFPTNSPQSNDLGLISELYSDDSDVYSPPLLSPSSTASGSPDRTISHHLELGARSQQLKSTRRCLKEMSFDEETSIVTRSAPTRKSPRKSSRKSVLEKENFDDNFITLLPKSPHLKKTPVQFEIKSSENFNTPKKRIGAADMKSVRRSPRSASKDDLMIRATSFYGNAAPILATNQTNRIQGMKCVFRPPQPSRAKAKLLFEEKPARKRERSKSMDSVREAKRRKPIFTGVHHAIPKPRKESASLAAMATKRESIREKAQKLTDLSRTPYRVKKTKQEGWEYTLRFTKPMRYDESPNLGEKRKFFKTSVRDSPSLSPGPSSETSSPNLPKKRKLLDTRKSYLSPEKPQLNAADLLDLIEDQEAEKLQDKPEVEDILLRLEEDDEEEKKREAEKQMLMNILEDSPTKVAAIESLSNCTASLDLNDSFSKSGCSRFSFENTKENQSPAQRAFSIFANSPNPPHNALTDVTNQGSSTKKKWRGVGEDQLQIDAGQKLFGACQCPDCGMVYQTGEAEDEMQHQAFHNNMTSLRHFGWKNENVVGCFGMDYVLVITGNDPKSWQQKALEVIALVDKSLGITSELSTVMHNQKVFLYIADKRVVGCMVACPVTKAYKMMSSESDIDICSEESFTVRCGVSRMWTLFSHRRRGVASRLLDTLRRNFMYGNILSRDDIAFSIPTSDGKLFATKYMDSPNFFVYVGY